MRVTLRLTAQAQGNAKQNGNMPERVDYGQSTTSLRSLQRSIERQSHWMDFGSCFGLFLTEPNASRMPIAARTRRSEALTGLGRHLVKRGAGMRHLPTPLSARCG